MPFDMKPVESSSISAYGYDEESQTLAVQFSSGTTYHYDGVPPEIAEELEQAESAGQYFHAKIRSAFSGEKQPEAEDDGGEAA